MSAARAAVYNGAVNARTAFSTNAYTRCSLAAALRRIRRVGFRADLPEGEKAELSDMIFECRNCGIDAVPVFDIAERARPNGGGVFLTLSRADAVELHGHLKLADGEDEPTLARIIAKLERQGVA